MLHSKFWNGNEQLWIVWLQLAEIQLLHQIKLYGLMLALKH